MSRPIPTQVHPLIQLLCEDRRYKVDAYQFVRDGIRHAQELLFPPAEGDEPVRRHISGQDLCHGLRHLAHEQFGYLAIFVLRSWGIQSTSDFGEVVYNLIRIGHMSKSDDDSREHFDNVYDFEQALLHDFTISPAKEMVR